MIVEKYKEVKITKRNIKHFKSKNYDIQLGMIIKVKTEDLTPGSHLLVEVKCDVCGQKKSIMFQKYIKNINNGGFYSCSTKCAQDKVKKTSLNKHGKAHYSQTKEYKNSVKNTSLEKYGVEHHSQSPIVKNKIKKTNQKRYGVDSFLEKKELMLQKIKDKYEVDNPFQAEEIKEKIKKTNLEKYGVEYPLQNPKILKDRRNNFKQKYGVDNPSKLMEVKNKRHKTIKDKYGVDNAFQLAKVIPLAIKAKNEKEKNRLIERYQYLNWLEINYEEGYYLIYCKKCDHEFVISPDLFRNRMKGKTILCTNCNPVNSTKSGLEIELLKFIQENYQGEMLSNKRKILNNKYELDIYLPDLKLAFEFNGLWWHNELNKDQKYHLNKTEACEDQEIKLIHVYEDDWLYKRKIIESRILNLLGQSDRIYARQCELKEVTNNKLIRQFLVENHLQGFVGSKVKLGLYYENQLISLMTFGKKRKAMNSISGENEYELLRFCNQKGLNVVGGASKLFKYFVKNYNPKEVISYADRSWSQGHLYEKLGFKYISKTPVNYYYIIDGIRKHRFNYRKDKLIKEGFNKNKTEHEIMLERGLYRIYDSGSLKYIKTF
jgi:hypothetical protein